MHFRSVCDSASDKVLKDLYFDTKTIRLLSAHDLYASQLIRDVSSYMYHAIDFLSLNRKQQIQSCKLGLAQNQTTQLTIPTFPRDKIFTMTSIASLTILVSLCLSCCNTNCSPNRICRKENSKSSQIQHKQPIFHGEILL